MKMTLRLLIALLIVITISNTSCKPTDYSSEINALKASRDSLAAALKVTNANLQSTNNAVAGLSTSISTIQSQLTVISGQITTLNTKLDALALTLAGNISSVLTIQSQIKTIQDQIAVLNTQQTATKVVVDNLVTTIASIQTQITSLISQVATLNSKQTNTDASLADIYNKLALSNSQLASLSLQFNALLAQLGLVVQDIDGNNYITVTIGSQIWMAENLRTTKYNDGIAIPLVTDNTTWANLTTPAFCWYNNDAKTNGSTYGALYNWYSVNTKKLCPTGWHVPSDIEWTTLTNYLGGTAVAGGKLKEAGVTHWLSPNLGATNESGFTALPAGNRYPTNGGFVFMGEHGSWWTSTQYSSTVYHRGLMYNYIDVYSNSAGQYTAGYSVRCIKN